MIRPRPHRWLAALPTIAMLGGAPLADRVQDRPLGMPFLLVWIVACVLGTSVVMAIVFALDERSERRDAGTPGGPR